MAGIRSKGEKKIRFRDQETLHHRHHFQCIEELTTHLQNNRLKSADANDLKAILSTQRGRGHDQLTDSLNSNVKPSEVLKNKHLAIVRSGKNINDDESSYAECITKALRYMKVMGSSLTTKPLLGMKFSHTSKRGKRDIIFVVESCVTEVEKRGTLEEGIYRVNGSAYELARLKKAFESNNPEAKTLLKAVDIHSVTGIFKAFLRESPETLFNDVLYRRLIETFNEHSKDNEDELSHELMDIFDDVPAQNKFIIDFVLDHLLKIHRYENENKMSLRSLAVVFGPTLLRSALNTTKPKDQLQARTADAMAQIGILHCLLQARSRCEQNMRSNITITRRNMICGAKAV